PRLGRPLDDRHRRRRGDPGPGKLPGRQPHPPRDAPPAAGPVRPGTSRVPAPRRAGFPHDSCQAARFVVLAVQIITSGIAAVGILLPARRYLPCLEKSCWPLRRRTAMLTAAHLALETACFYAGGANTDSPHALWHINCSTASRKW